MKKEELIERLTKIARDMNGDPEAAHTAADDALIEYINDEAVTVAWNQIDKWYA